jgi:HNH endonuclease
MKSSRKKRANADGPSAIGARLRPLGFERYADYLASEHWREVRKRYRESDRPQRCKCGAEGTQLHHTTYVRLGRESLTDLVLLCENCHRRRHGLSKRADPAELAAFLAELSTYSFKAKRLR